ncbi:MAG: hypothetical protein ACREJW_04880, partial [Candidatus Methylomirabilales bacterium]
SLAVNSLVDAFAAAVAIALQLQTSEITKWYFNETANVSNLPPGFSWGMQLASLRACEPIRITSFMTGNG